MRRVTFWSQSARLIASFNWIWRSMKAFLCFLSHPKCTSGIFEIGFFLRPPSAFDYSYPRGSRGMVILLQAVGCFGCLRVCNWRHTHTYEAHLLNVSANPLKDYRCYFSENRYLSYQLVVHTKWPRKKKLRLLQVMGEAALSACFEITVGEYLGGPSG